MRLFSFYTDWRQKQRDSERNRREIYRKIMDETYLVTATLVDGQVLQKTVRALGDPSWTGRFHYFRSAQENATQVAVNIVTQGFWSKTHLYPARLITGVDIQKVGPDDDKD